MRFFISAVPFFDANMVVHAYQMMTQDGNKLMGAVDDYRMLGGELLAPELEFLREVGTEPFAGENDFFVRISKYQLLVGMPLSMQIPPEHLVCVIHKDTLSDNAASAKLSILKRKGYKLAIDGYPQAISMDTAVKVFDYILLSSDDINFQSELKEIRPFIFKIRLVITDVPDMESFKKYSGARGVLLSGNFYSKPITKGNVDISPLKINALNLLGKINDEDSLDLGEAATIIERDPALSISLLRFINLMNPDRSRKIDSIRNAVAILGQKEVKKWASIAISVGMGEDRPSEITRLSLIRAKFAENLAPAFEMALKSGALFMAGLFSLLDVILQMPLEKAIDEVAASAEIRTALLDRKGQISEVLSLIFAYEHADWYTTSILMVKNGINVEELSQAFLDALLWYRHLLDAIAEEDDSEADAQPDANSET
ncbi:MAG: HDOD domain-containing protein [Oscillospiraceae bacterium]|nr:HDOD domain-containing protein [Oscillospiraceae bacterium]